MMVLRASPSVIATQYDLDKLEGQYQVSASATSSQTLVSVLLHLARSALKFTNHSPGGVMASEQLKKVLEIIKSQPLGGGGGGKPTVEKMRSGMEKVAERVASDVSCQPVDAGGVKAEWI